MRYEDFMSQISNSVYEDNWLYDDEIGKFVNKEDIRITIQSDRSESIGDNRFYEEWASNFPDSNAYRKKYFLQYNGITINTFYTVRVDGGRSDIPYPRLEDMTITREQYNIARIVNSIHGNSFNEYLSSANIEIRDGE